MRRIQTSINGRFRKCEIKSREGRGWRRKKTKEEQKVVRGRLVVTRRNEIYRSSVHLMTIQCQIALPDCRNYLQDEKENWVAFYLFTEIRRFEEKKERIRWRGDKTSLWSCKDEEGETQRHLSTRIPLFSPRNNCLVFARPTRRFRRRTKSNQERRAERKIER